MLLASVGLIWGCNLVVNFFYTKGEEDFLNVLVGNSLGNVGQYKIALEPFYFFKNTFGFRKNAIQTVGTDFGSVKDLVVDDLTEVVYLYNTFQTDKYKSTYFNSYTISSFVTQASFILKEYLGEYNIGSVVEEKKVAEVLNEENILYTNSYAGSMVLLKRAKEKYPSLEYFLDLQISDYSEEVTTVEIEGLKYAKILFVVGSDYDSFLENQKFAKELNEILEEINPSLTRGVSLRGGEGYQGVYNQDFSNQTLLIQVGGKDNTIDEVNRSLKVLALVLATYIEGDYVEEK